MKLLNCKEFSDDENQTIQFQFENDDKTICYSGFWKKKNYENIISVTTQIGCNTQCALFCNVQKYVRNINVTELMYQVETIKNYMNLNNQFIKVAMVKEGEPFDNYYIEDMLEAINQNKMPYLKISTSVPYDCKQRIINVFRKNIDMDLEIQLQISLSSTNDDFRMKHVKKRLMTLEEICIIGNDLYKTNIYNNKKFIYLTLSFTIYEESEFDIEVIKRYFSPEIFCIRIRDASNSVARGKNYTRLTEKIFLKYKIEIEKAGYLFIDGRSEQIAVDNMLTIGLYELKGVFK